ncbi:unnamed protein product [Caenorhabditis bovis]|uniref:Uncharacterized protein n=1 Tax=Caenorhabditis bovis TaxID=2654633 RepID=A0A8S1EDR7_9PELO|nr:unnamed protein product [Caenorhabditis bovis]
MCIFKKQDFEASVLCIVDTIIIILVDSGPLFLIFLKRDLTISTVNAGAYIAFLKNFGRFAESLLALKFIIKPRTNVINCDPRPQSKRITTV